MTFIADMALTLATVAPMPVFDPEAATQAYLSTLKGAARAKSDAYFEGGYWLILWGALIGMALDWFILKGRFSVRFRDWAERVTKRPFLQFMLWSLPYGILGYVLLFPWTLYTRFFREKQYDLLSQNFGGWFGEQMIDVAINAIVFAFLVALIIWGIRKSPKRWWLWGTGFAALLVALMVMVTPVFIAPLFNTYTEMKPGPLRDRIVAMAKAQNVPVEHIYVFDQSKQHKRISANVSGLGPTIRISLNDNLLDRSTPDEVASVMGHELGHYVLGHLPRSVLFISLLFGFSFFCASRLVPWMYRKWGVALGLRGVDDVAAFPLYSIVLTLIMLLATPVLNTIVRTSESEADAFGLDVARAPDGFANIAMKLSEYRKIEPGALEEALFYDHPSGRTRVRMAMDWKAKHLGDLPPPDVADVPPQK